MNVIGLGFSQFTGLICVPCVKIVKTYTEERELGPLRTLIRLFFNKLEINSLREKVRKTKYQSLNNGMLKKKTTGIKIRHTLLCHHVSPS